MYFVYILQSEGRYYVGQTNSDLSSVNKDTLYVGLHKPCYCSSWDSGARSELHAETFRDGWTNSKGEESSG